MVQCGGDPEGTRPPLVVTNSTQLVASGRTSLLITTSRALSTATKAKIILYKYYYLVAMI